MLLQTLQIIYIYIRDFKKKNNAQNDEKQNLNFNASAISENNVLTRNINLENEQLETEHITITPVKEPQKIMQEKLFLQLNQIMKVLIIKSIQKQLNN